MKMVMIEIQMYEAGSFIAIVDKENFDRDLKNVELKNTIFVEVETIKGQKIKFNPNYAEYIRYLKVVNDETVL